VNTGQGLPKADLIGKHAYSQDNIQIGSIVKIIDQPDSEEDQGDTLGDISSDLFQVVVKLDPEVFESLDESMETLFSSQTIESASPDGVKFILPKEAINAIIKQSL
jgi:hypothetical protein